MSNPLYQASCPAAYPTACSPASLFTAIVLSSLRFSSQRQHEVDITSPPTHTEYDFVVVGGGSAGCVVASRLSENPNWKVLLLEAGSEEPLHTEVPAFNRLFIGTQYDWHFITQPSGWDRGQAVPRGRVMGGSSSINGMLYSRGSHEDYDHWERLGNPGWSFRDVLPFFKKSERNNQDDLDRKFHSEKGVLDVQHYPYRDENVPILLEAFHEIGLAFNRDHTGRHQVGSTLLQFTQRHGHRRSANRAFIFPVRRLRPNLTVKTSAVVQRVIINPRTKQAVGVEFDSPLGRQKVRVRKEVIVSSGALQSPRVLMLSGIGPRQHLLDAGITPIVDNPNVGLHLKDHLTTMHTVNFTLTKTATARVDTLPRRVADLERYNNGDLGPLSATGVRQVAAFFRTKHQRQGPTRPWIHIEIIGQLTGADGGSHCSNCTPPGEDSIWYNQFRLSPVLLHPRYSGKVRLNTSDPFAAKPLVFLNISLEEDEKPTWVEGFKRAAELGNTEAFRRAGITLDTPPLDGCPGVEPASDKYWECAGRLGAQTWGHLTGSCRMGADPANSVVDAKLRVHGVKGLRVVDASIMPDLPSGNTNGPTIMIGERGADFIRKTHCCRRTNKKADDNLADNNLADDNLADNQTDDNQADKADSS